MDNTDNSTLKEARELMENAENKTDDPSDAGMLFYALTGNESGNPNDAKKFLEANLGQNNSPSPEPAPAPAPAPTPAPEPVSDAIRINAGGEAFTDGNSNRWSADDFSVGGRTYSTTAGIDNTQNDTLFQSERFGDFSYEIPVENGEYRVKLGFAEIYWQESNKRVFDVVAEDNLAIDNLDIYKSAATDENEALERSFNVDVQDGILDLDFDSNINNAKIASIEVEPI